jgi:DNA-binding NtrC family response regulator
MSDASERPEPIVFLGEHPSIVALRDDMARAARTQAKVLILGETGAGKEVVARWLHDASARQSRAFVAVNCSGIPETLLESELFGHVRGSFTGAYRDKPGLVRQADGGTLFLDELGEMSLRMQAALLRFAESGEIHPVGADRPAGHTNVRLITATHRDLSAQVAGGAFREDLYYRLNVIQLWVPPLRARASDIPLLMGHFLQEASTAHRLPCPTLTPEADTTLLAYGWPGNVRELKNLAERLVVCDLQRAIVPEDLRGEFRSRTAGLSERAGASGDVAPRSAIPDAAQIVEALWGRLQRGDTFWSIVAMYRAHEITRADLRVLVHRGLQQTRGHYRTLLRMFNLPPQDYKRFHNFLTAHDCRLPFQEYRKGLTPLTSRSDESSAPHTIAS